MSGVACRVPCPAQLVYHAEDEVAEVADEESWLKRLKRLQAGPHDMPGMSCPACAKFLQLLH